jgi:hypothetical protein
MRTQTQRHTMHTHIQHTHNNNTHNACTYTYAYNTQRIHIQHTRAHTTHTHTTQHTPRTSRALHHTIHRTSTSLPVSPSQHTQMSPPYPTTHLSSSQPPVSRTCTLMPRKSVFSTLRTEKGAAPCGAWGCCSCGAVALEMFRAPLAVVPCTRLPASAQRQTCRGVGSSRGVVSAEFSPPVALV